MSLLHGCPGQYHPGSALNLQTCSSIYPYRSLYISLTRPLYDLRLPSRKTSSDPYNLGHQCPKRQTLRQFMPCGQNGSSNNNGSTVLGILGNTCTSRRVLVVDPLEKPSGALLPSLLTRPPGGWGRAEFSRWQLCSSF